MKYYVFFFIAALVTFNSQAQGVGELLPNPHFKNSILDTCDFDTNKIIYKIVDYEVYQTTNNLWDGPIDSSRCIQLKPLANQYGSIRYDEIDTTKILFIKARLDSATSIFLDSNSVFNFRFSAVKGDAVIDTSSFCGNYYCSHVLIQIDIPDSNYASRTLRTYRTTHFPDYNSWVSGSNAFSSGFCLPSEKFETQYLKNVIIALKFSEANPSDSLRLYHFSFEQVMSYGYPVPIPLKSIHASYSFNNEDYAHIADLFNLGGIGGTAMIMYVDSTYPSPSHVSFVPVYPVDTHSTQVKNINVTVDPEWTLIFQPFAQLRGAPVNVPPDSPAVFHQVTLINNGGKICLPPFIDVMVHPGDNIYYKSGEVEFGGENSCMQFMPGAKLIIDKNSTLNYGDPYHRGLLLLRGKSEIVMMKNSTLNMYGKIILNNGNTGEEFYMTLPATAKLVFKPGSGIFNGYSTNQAMKFNVYMKGGILDDSGLPPEERTLINRIYDEEDLQDNLLAIFPNPTTNIFMIKQSCSTDIAGNVLMYDMYGHLRYTWNIMFKKGLNEVPINFGPLPAGQYLIQVRTTEVHTKKLLILN